MIGNLKRMKSFWERNRTFSITELRIIDGIKNKSFNETRVIHHGHCHGCITPDVNINRCRDCFCWDGDDGNGLNVSPSQKQSQWRNGIDNFFGYGSEEEVDIIKLANSKDFRDAYPEYAL